MKKYLFILTVLFVGNLKSFAQKCELGKVTIEELKEKLHPKDTSAVAAILFQKGHSYFEFSQIQRDFKLVTDVVVRVKIYKKEGFEWANKEISYCNVGSHKETVSFSDVCTYSLVNGKVVKDKFRKGDEIEKKINKNFSQKKITPPNVKEGSIVEYRYTITTSNIAALPYWEFELEIPVNYSEFETNIPEFYSYKTYLRGSLRSIEQKKITNKKINIDKPARFRPIFNVQKIDDLIGNQKVFEFYENDAKYIVENIPALKHQTFINNIHNYTSRVYYEFSGFQWSKSNGQLTYQTWEDVVKNIYEIEDFGNELKKQNYFEEDLKAILQGLNTNEEKIAVIFQYVKSRMNWNEYKGYVCEAGVKKAYETKTGNVAEINLMLTSMLRYAGINANPVLVSTRDNGINIFPSRTAFNYVIAAVEIENDLILLDATSKNAQPNIMPFRTLNWFGRIIRKDGSSAQVNLMPKTNSKDVISLMVTIDKEGLVEGKIKEQYFDYNAFSFREKYSDVSKESYLEKLEKKLNNIEIGEYEVLNNKDLSKPVIESYSFKKNNSVEIIGDKMYFSPLLFFTTSENPFKQEIREYPVDFVFPNQNKYVINITIPDGYVVESIPAPISIAMSENLGSFKFNISNKEKQIQLLVTQDINSAIFSAEYYEELKAFFGEMIKKQTEKIILKKV